MSQINGISSQIIEILCMFQIIGIWSQTIESHCISPLTIVMHTKLPVTMVTSDIYLWVTEGTLIGCILPDRDPCVLFCISTVPILNWLDWNKPSDFFCSAAGPSAEVRRRNSSSSTTGSATPSSRGICRLVHHLVQAWMFLRWAMTVWWSGSWSTKFSLSKEFVFGPIMNGVDVGTDLNAGVKHFQNVDE